ncbi:MAG: hypothetical protein F4095_14125, partial [Acidimicrobiia bacterium]|nr:hypothetical protein [Acidimicrobiia bacterium]
NALADQTVTATVTDDDTAPTGISLSVSRTTMAEGDNPQVIIVTARPDGSTTFGVAQTVTVTVDGSGNTAAVDFSPVASFVITLPIGATSATNSFTLTAIDDSVDESSETVTVSGTASPSSVAVSSATISLTDDDATPTSITLTASPTTVTESGTTGSQDTTVTVTATVDGSTTFGTAQTVSVSVAGTDTESAVQFTSRVAGSDASTFDITIPAATVNAQGTFVLRVPGNQHEEDDETVTVSGASGSLTVNSETIALNDDDPGPTDFTVSVSPTAAHAEDAGAVSYTVTVQYRGTGFHSYSVDTTVTVSVAGSGSSDVVDFAPVADFDITIPKNTMQGTGSFTLTPTDDAVDELDETVTVSGDSAKSIPAATTGGEATIVLADDDPTTVTLSAPAGDVGEASGTKDVTVMLGRTLAAGESITVPLSVVGVTVSDDYTLALTDTNTAVTLVTSGDYSAQDPALQFDAGATSATLRFDPVDNARRTQPWVLIDFAGSPVLTEVRDATTVGGPLGFAITDDETGDIIVPGSWSLKPSGRQPGQSFRLVFASSTERDGTSTDIADYDAFIRGLLTGGHADIVPYAGFFKALASTSATNAADHTGIGGAGAQITTNWLGGLQVANGYAPLRGEWAAQASPRDETGTLATVAPGGYFTGSTAAGAASSSPLGSNSVTLGFLNDSGAGRSPLGSTSTTTSTNQRKFLGLSPVFKVAETPTLTISAGPAVTEGANATYTITASPAPSDPITVGGLITDPGSYYSGTAGIVNNLVSIPANTATATFTLATTNDSTDEADDKLGVRLLSGTGYLVGDPDLAEVTINDDDSTSVTLAWSSDPTAVSEGSSQTLLLSLGRQPDTGETLAATLSFDGTATRGTDYTLACTGTGITCANLNDPAQTATVTFAALASRTATITVSALEDDSHPETENLNIGVTSVAVTGFSGGTTITDNAGNISITSVEPADVEASIATAAYSAGEAAADRSVDVAVSLSKGAPAGGLTVAYTVGGTATAGSDYTMLGGSVAFTAGATTANITVAVLHDNIDDDAETIIITLTDGTSYDLGAAKTTTVTIADDDAAPTQVALSVSPSSITESATGTGRTVTVTATVQGSTRFGTSKTVAVTAAKTSGTVGVGSIAGFNITIAPGAASGQATVTVVPEADSVDETDAVITFSGTLSAVTVASTTLNVTDDDAAPTQVALSVSPSSITESATGTGRTVTVTATVQGSTRFGTSKTVAVTAAKTSGTVGVGSIAGFNITIAPGAASGQATVTVVPEADSVDETDAVITFSGTLSAVTVASTTFTVTDDDGAPGSIELSVSPTAVTENAGATPVTVTATILGSTRFGTSKTVTVSVAGSGTPGVVGFAPVSSFSLTINANQASGTAMFTLTPTNNSTYQSSETITVSGVLSGVTVSSATLDLTDDELPPPVASFSQSAESALEATSPRLVTVTLDRVVTSPVTVAYTISGTATSGSDFTAPSGSVTVAASAQTAAISLTVADDDDHEDAETIVLTLSTGSGYTVGTPSVHTATIIDNEEAPVGGILEEGATLIPSGLGYGDRFRLLFVTSTKHSASSVDIADYNSVVQTRAAAGHSEIAGFASGFRVVASTAAVDATDNTDTNATHDGAGVPIYWIGGTKVADDYADFYDGDWDSRAAVDESGSTVDVDNNGDFSNGNGIWTGSASNGTGQSGLELGTDTPRIADLGTDSLVSTPLSLLAGVQSERPKQNARYLYALSPLLEYVGPELSVTTASSGVTEGAVITFTISGAPAVPGTISVGYTVTQTGDFVCDSDQGDHTVSFTGSSATVTVCTENDQTGESSGTATVTLTEHATYRVSATQNSATVNVWDNDGGGVTLPEMSVSAGPAVTEGTAASFTINASQTSSSAVTVDYTVTASGGYVTSANLGAKQVTLAANATSVTVTVPTAGDATDEPAGAVTVTIDGGTGYTVSGTAGSGTVAVSDDDATTVALSVPDRLLSEGDSSATATLRLTLNRGLVSGESLGVPLGFSGGAVGTDFSVALSGSPAGVSLSGSTVTFTGPNTGSSATQADVTVTASDDVDGSNERVSVSIPVSSGPGNPRLTQTGLGTATGSGPANPWLLIDDEDESVSAPASVSVPPNWGLIPSGLSAGDRFRLLFISSTKRDAQSADIADYNGFVQDRAAAGHTDIQAYSGGFRAVASTAFVDASANTATSGSDTSRAIYWLGGPKAADNYTDFWDGSWDHEVSPLRDEAGAQVTFNSANRPWTGTASGGAKASASHLGTVTPTGGALVANAGNPGGSPGGPVNGGAAQRASLDTQLTLYGLSPVFEVAAAGTPLVSVTAGTSPVTEGTAASFTLTASPAPTNSITVSYTVAQTGSYVTAANRGTKQVSIGTLGTATVSVPTQDDSTDEPNGSVTVTVNMGTGYAPGSSSSARVTVNDDDVPAQPQLTVARTAASVTEGTSAAFTISASPPSTGPITVRYRLAQSGSFVAGSVGTKTLSLTGASAAISVATVDDNTNESNGTITVTILTNTGYTLGSPQSATVTVRDNDTGTTTTTTTTTTTPGGGGGGGGAPPSRPSDDDNGGGATLPGPVIRGPVWGLWGDGATQWTIHDGSLVPVSGADAGRQVVLDSANSSPRGIWSNGAVVWVSDAVADRLFAYDFATGQRVPGREVVLDSANGSPRGIWSNGAMVWVTDTGSARSLFVYRLTDGTLAGVYTLNAANSAPRGIWSDGTTVWVSDGADARVYAYRLPAPPATGTARSVLQRQTTLELALQLAAAGHRVPGGIWSNGVDMHVWDPTSGRPRSYPLPTR